MEFLENNFAFYSIIYQHFRILHFIAYFYFMNNFIDQHFMNYLPIYKFDFLRSKNFSLSNDSFFFHLSC